MFVRPTRFISNSSSSLLVHIRPSQTLTKVTATSPHPFNRRTFAQTSSKMTLTIAQEIASDHRKIEEYYDNVLNATDDDTRTRWQNQFVWEVARHSIAEEIVVYPAFEKHLPGGKEMASKDRGEHQVVKEKLETFQNMKSTDPNFIPTIKSIMADLSQHIKEEEGHDMPALEKALSTEDSHGLVKSFERRKAIVPSRSHPSAPNKPPFETIAGLPVGIIDHITDMFRKFPDKTISPNPSTK